MDIGLRPDGQLPGKEIRKITSQVNQNQDGVHRSALHFFYSLLVLAVLANGLHFWLQKTQLIPSPTYDSYLLELEAWYEDESLEQPILELEGFYVVPGNWIITKLLKDFFILAFAVTSLLFLRQAIPKWTPALILPAALGLLIGISFVYSILAYGAWVAVAGLRPFAYLVAGMLGLWAAHSGSLKLLSYYLLTALGIELILSVYEYFYGIPLFSTARLFNRINGTFSFPASLGIYAIVAIAFAGAFSQVNKLLLIITGLVFVYLTGSATALVLLVVLLAAWIVMAVPDAWKPGVRIASLSIIFVMVLTLPSLVARHDVFESLFGRVEVAEDYWKHKPNVTQILFGKGLGIGSNALNTMLTNSTEVAYPVGVEMYHARADSTPMALINQLGVVGVSLFYLILAIAAWRDRQALPIYITLLLAGLTVNVLELFPINFLLGLLFVSSLLSTASTANTLSPKADSIRQGSR